MTYSMKKQHMRKKDGPLADKFSQFQQAAVWAEKKAEVEIKAFIFFSRRSKLNARLAECVNRQLSDHLFIQFA